MASPLEPVKGPNTFSGLVVPVVPIFTVEPVLKLVEPAVRPARAVAPDTDKLVDDVVPDDKPASVDAPDTDKVAKLDVLDTDRVARVVVPKTDSDDVAPDVPTLRAAPFTNVNPVIMVPLVSDKLAMVAVPNTFIELVAPEVPTLSVCPFGTVNPAAAVIKALVCKVEHVVALSAEIPDIDIEVPVKGPNTFSGLALPDMPILTAFPLETVKMLLKVETPEKLAVVAIKAARVEVAVTVKFLVK